MSQTNNNQLEGQQDPEESPLNPQQHTRVQQVIPKPPTLEPSLLQQFFHHPLCWKIVTLSLILTILVGIYILHNEHINVVQNIQILDTFAKSQQLLALGQYGQKKQDKERSESELEQLRNEQFVTTERLIQIQEQLIKVASIPDNHKLRQKQQQIQRELQAIMKKQQDLLLLELVRLNNTEDQIEIKSNFPKIIWIYSNQQKQDNLLDQLIMSHLQDTSSRQNYQIQFINITNYKIYLNDILTVKVQKILSYLQNLKTEKSQYQIDLQNNFNNIHKKIIMMGVLIENGGISIDKDIILTQGLGWLENIDEDPYINRGKIFNSTKYVTFYNKGLSSTKQLFVPQNQGQIKQLVHFPGWEDYFFAAAEEGQYLSLLLQEYINILMNPNQVKIIVDTLNIKELTGIKPYSQAIYIANYNVLKKKQDQLQKQNQHALAIDYFGLSAISNLYGPNKLHFILGQANIERIYQHLSKLTLNQLQDMYGPLKYLTILYPKQKINQFLRQAINNKQQYYIKEGSFLQIYLYPNSNQTFIISPEESEQSVLQWEKLPRKVWTYTFDQGSTKNHIRGACIQNIKQIAQQSGFQFIHVDSKNISNYIRQDRIKRIQEALKKLKDLAYQKARSYLVRLAIVGEYGGVWMQPTLVPVQTLDWIVDIAQNPSIWNRFGDLPKVLLFFNPLQGGPFRWEFKRGTKAAWHLGYQVNLIAAQAKNQLILRWFGQSLVSYQDAYFALQEKYKLCGISEYQLVSNYDQRKEVIDNLKCIFGRVQRSLSKQKPRKQCAQYYGLWLLNGFSGQLKLRGETNLQGKWGDTINSFFWKYPRSYVEGLLGQVNYFIKPSSEMVLFLEEADPNKFKQIHKSSFFSLYLSKK